MIWTALLFGLLGSVHCVGMCGPIALALPVGGMSASRRFMAVLSYNFGRMTTYGMLGGMFGAVGMTFAWAGLQQALSIGLGAALLLIVLLPYFPISSSGIMTRISKGLGPVRKRLSRQFGKQGLAAMFVTGLLNGLLPCGLVYLAIAGAIATSQVWQGVAFMVLFGLGTVPAMLAVSMASGWLSVRARPVFRRVVPLFVGLMAILLIIRGLNLGIPYVSPQLTKSAVHHCH